MKYIRKKLKESISKIWADKVLSIALILGIVSTIVTGNFLKAPEYIDWHTLIILFGLMSVMAGLQKKQFFITTGSSLLRFTRSSRQLMLVLTMLTFFFSMVITNDVALITFVPFAIVVLKMAKHETLIPVTVVLQTVAANMGSSMTPIGNPQNIYLYGIADMGMVSFALLMLPYVGTAFLFIVVCIYGHKNEEIQKLEGMQIHIKREFKDKVDFALYFVLFAFAIMTVAKFVTGQFLLLLTVVIVAAVDRKVFKEVDYGLLLTFIGFFVFVGNMQDVTWFAQFVDKMLQGREVITAVIASQVISNVPAALLLSGFTDNIEALIVGTNLGGLGTLIASMASLISYKQIALTVPEEKGGYFIKFTVANIILLALVLIVYFLTN